MPQATSTRKIEVFRPGTFTAMSGASFTASARDLAALADRYDAENNPVPVVVGHPRTDAPAYGWVKSFTYDADAERLIAEVGELEPGFASAVSDGRYKKISMSFHVPGAPSNPAGDALYPKHVGFLGGAAPAVPGLKPVSFTDAADLITVEVASFADPAFRDVASLFRRFREWLIETRDAETADKVMPDYTIRWIDEAGTLPAPQSAAFAASPETVSILQEPIMSTTTPPAHSSAPAPDADLAAREAALRAREDALNARETEQRHGANVSFAEGLIASGQLATGHKAKLVALLDGLAGASSAAISFSENGSEVTTGLVDLAKSLFETAPKIVEFGETDMGDAPEASANDAENLAREAIAFQATQRAAGITVSAADAVTHVEKTRGLRT